MSSIVENQLRIVNFTSSQAYRLMGDGKREMTNEELKTHKLANPKSKAKLIVCDNTPDSKFYTYVKEKFYEWLTGTSLDSDSYSQSTEWGNVIEGFAFQQLSMDYILTSQKTDKHPTIKGWTGSKDAVTRDGKTVADIKCLGKKNHCETGLIMLQDNLKMFKDSFEDKYYQLVSNAAINGCSHGELIIFIPKKEQANEILQYVLNIETDEPWRSRFIYENIENKKLYKLPFISDDAKIPNIIKYRFEIPKKEITKMEKRINMANTELNRMIEEYMAMVKQAVELLNQ